MRLLIGSTILLFMLPRVALQCLRAWYRQEKISLYTREYGGRNLNRIQHRIIMIAHRPIIDFDIWFLYIKGAVNLVGPKALDFQDTAKLSRHERKRNAVRPGLISPFQIKKMAGIAHQCESSVSIDFAKNASTQRRLQLLFIWLTQRFLAPKKIKLCTPKNFELFGVKLSNLSMETSIDKIMNKLNGQSNNIPAKFGFVNADCANQYYSDREYQSTLRNFDEVFADGVGVKIAARLNGIRLKENVNGTDMFPLLCERLDVEKKNIYLLGASKSVIAKVASKLEREYPNINVTGYNDGYTYADRPEELCSIINASRAELVFIAMGAPRQERWIEENAPRLNTKALIGVGGLFDFYSQEVSRAPVWLRELSLEWVWRLAVQPLDKGKRYLIGNPLFLIRSYKATRNVRAINTTVNGESNASF